MALNVAFAVALMLGMVLECARLERRERRSWTPPQKPREENWEAEMTGPIGQMDGWQQALVGSGLLALMVLLKLRPSKAQREARFQKLKRECMHERLASARPSEGSGCSLAEDPTLDVSRPPVWWGEMKWKSGRWR